MVSLGSNVPSPLPLYKYRFVEPVPITKSMLPSLSTSAASFPLALVMASVNCVLVKEPSPKPVKR